MHFNAMPFDLFNRIGVHIHTIMEVPSLLPVLSKYFESNDIADIVIISDDYRSADIESVKTGLRTMGHAWAIKHLVFAQSKVESEDRNIYWGRIFDAFKLNSFITDSAEVQKKISKHCKHGTLLVNPKFTEEDIVHFICPGDYKSTEHYRDAFNIIG